MTSAEESNIIMWRAVYIWILMTPKGLKSRLIESKLYTYVDSSGHMVSLFISTWPYYSSPCLDHRRTCHCHVTVAKPWTHFMYLLMGFQHYSKNVTTEKSFEILLCRNRWKTTGFRADEKPSCVYGHCSWRRAHWKNYYRGKSWFIKAE